MNKTRYRLRDKVKVRIQHNIVEGTITTYSQTLEPACVRHYYNIKLLEPYHYEDCEYTEVGRSERDLDETNPL